MEDKLFDIRGQICPSTLLIVLKEVNALKGELLSGKIRLIVLTDNRDGTTTIPSTMESMGFISATEPADGHYRIIISGGKA